MRQITDIEIKDRLAFDNPWWETNEVENRFRSLPFRSYFQEFYTLIKSADVRRAVVLMGPRRVGKTVMINQAVTRLIDDGIDPKHIMAVSLEAPTYTGKTLEDLLGLFQDLHGHDRNSRLFVFYDEIQYHKDWERHLKSLVDSYHSIQFVVSGSAAAALKLKSVESGAGRFTDFTLPPLLFSEFLRFRGAPEPAIIRDDTPRLNRFFVEYLNFGGFPEVVLNEAIRRDMPRFVADDIISKVLLRDLPSLYGITDTQELNRLFNVIAYNTGFEANVPELSTSSGVSANTIKKYLDYLEAAFLIHRVYRVDQNARRFRKRSQFKVYLTNPSMRAALFDANADLSQENDPAMGALCETAYVAQHRLTREIDDIHYGRWKTGEVDFVYLDKRKQRVSAVDEVKWSDRIFNHPEELKELIGFCQRNSLHDAWVLTRSFRGERHIDGIRVDFIPVAEKCLEFGVTNLPWR